MSNFKFKIIFLGTRFDQRQETFALGWSNLISGAMGGLPVTGVLVRAAANVASGATHKTSQFINALVCMIVYLVLLPGFTYIPMPVIASMLMVSACRLIPFKVMGNLLL